MEIQVLNITGMTCAACANRIEKSVQKLAGVSHANVNIASEKLFVEYDSSVVGLNAIKDSIIKIGYE